VAVLGLDHVQLAVQPRARLLATALALGLVAALWLSLSALLAASADGASAKRIVSLLNAQRATNGIPAGIAEDPQWSEDCAQHNAYEKRNHVFGHAETEGKPGYSAQGNLIAATSVLAEGIYWGDHDPYDNAPYHLFDLLNPRIDSIGAADSEGFGCVEIELGAERAAPARVTGYSFPGNGHRGVAIAERADELPMTPAQTLGLGTKASGPNLLVYFDGPWTNGSRARLTSATLSSTHGSVALKWLDNTTSDLLAPTGAILVPVSPLRPATNYHARVQGTVTGVIPASSIEPALSEACEQEADGSVSCGQPPPTACVEDFATQQSICGLSESWPVKEEFSFTTAKSHQTAR